MVVGQNLLLLTSHVGGGLLSMLEFTDFVEGNEGGEVPANISAQFGQLVAAAEASGNNSEDLEELVLKTVGAVISGRVSIASVIKCWQDAKTAESSSVSIALANVLWFSGTQVRWWLIGSKRILSPSRNPLSPPNSFFSSIFISSYMTISPYILNRPTQKARDGDAFAS